jgi:cytochrome c oxidase subunit 4
MSHYVVPRSTYYIVFALLIVLLVLTVLAARQDLDARTGIAGLNVMIALAIAAAKAVLIVLFFMQIKYASPLQRVFAASGALFLTILFAITFADYISRGPWEVNPGDMQEPPGRTDQLDDPDDPAD